MWKLKDSAGATRRMKTIFADSDTWYDEGSVMDELEELTNPKVRSWIGYVYLDWVVPTKWHKKNDPPKRKKEQK